MFQPHILYIMGDMIPSIHGSILFQDSSLNRTPRENCYILGYKGPKDILEGVPDRAQTLIYVVKVLDPDDEIMTHGSPYKFSMLNSPQKNHLGKLGISPIWRIQFFSNLWGWKEDLS